MEAKTCVWFLQSLWKAGSLFPPRIPLLDTLVADSSSLNGMRWLFQDKKGLLKRKSQENCTYDRICRKFMDGKTRDAQVASLISGNEFRLFTTFQFQDFMSQGHLTVSTALQVFPVPSSDLHNRYILQVKISDNKLHFRYEAVQMIDGKATVSVLTAQNYCQTMRDIEKEVRGAIESHCKCKVVQLKLVFLQDQDRVLWLMGSEECFLYPLEAFNRMHRELTPTRQLDQNEGKPSFRTCSSAKRPPRSVRKDSHCEQPSIMSNASSTHFLLNRKNKCPGDFCKYVLSVPQPLKKTEADVDDLV